MFQPFEGFRGELTWGRSALKIGAKEGTVREKVENVLKEIRLLLQADGGDVELIGVTEDGIVQVHLHGVCSTCPGSMMTLRQGVERLVKEQVPEVREVIAV